VVFADRLWNRHARKHRAYNLKGRFDVAKGTTFVIMRQDELLDDFGWAGHEASSGEVVATFYSPLEAEVAAARLRAEGIPCFLVNRTAQSVLPHLQLLMRLYVPTPWVEHARAVLAETRAELESASTASSELGMWIVLFAFLGLLLAILLVQMVNG